MDHETTECAASSVAVDSAPRNRTHLMVGRTGRLTGKVGPGLVGEVMLSVRGGSEAFNAYPFNDDEVIPTGALVVVVEYHEPRTVYVARAR
jgi:hypothetical protein